MLNSGQNQNAEGQSVAIQAGRDVYLGMSVSDIREVVNFLLRENFPQLRDEARRVAEEYVEAFGQTLEDRLVEKAQTINFDKLREPDVQATINDAVLATARKGETANPHLLAVLVAERMARNSDNFKDIVLSEAVLVVPRLTSRQIALLTMLHALLNVKIGPSTMEQLEIFGSTVLRLSQPGFGLSMAQKLHLQYAAVASINPIVTRDIFDFARTTYPELALADMASFKQGVRQHAPSFFILLMQFTAENLGSIHLTSVGQAIALSNLAGHLPGLNYSTWLN